MAVEIDYNRVLADLEARRASLDAAITGIKQMLLRGAEGAASAESVTASVSGAAAPPVGEPGEVRSDSFFGLSIPDAIKKCFLIMKRPLQLTEVTKFLKDGGLLTRAQNLVQTVSSTLQRMRRQGETVSLGDGKWGLAEWYPGMRKDKIEAQSKPKAKKRKRAKAKAAANQPQPKSSKYTPEQMERVKALRAAGKGLGEIQKETSVPAFVARHWIKPTQNSDGTKDTEKQAAQASAPTG